MKTNIKILMAGVFLLTIACNQSSKQSNSVDTTNDKSAQVVSGDEVTACPHSSKIFWKGTKPGGEHNGFVKLKEGNYIVENNKLLGGEFVINLNSIVDIDLDDEEMNAKLVKHLKSSDFFNVDSFPEGKFVITAVEEINDGEYNSAISGDLTLKSITHPISFKANVKVHDGKVSATSEDIVLNRTKWNVNYGSKSIFKELKDKFINDEFSLKLDMHSM